MADSGAVRQARYKAHKAGDHHLCRHLRDFPARPSADVVDPDPGELDPVGEMRNLGARLAGAYAADPGNAALARELRSTLVVLAGMVPDDGDDLLAEILSQPGSYSG
jgi:hypothetical protein